jgi:hypothetical protein
MDMRYYWIRNCVRQGQFLVYWSCDQGNLADYFTKHHPATHHRLMCPVYLHQAIKSSAVQEGCVDLQSRSHSRLKDSSPAAA